MNLLIWFLVGGIAGAIADIFVGGKGGCITNIVVGMIGSIIGGVLLSFINTGTLTITTAFTDLTLESILVSALGAIVLLVLLKTVAGD